MLPCHEVRHASGRSSAAGINDALDKALSLASRMPAPAGPSPPRSTPQVLVDLGTKIIEVEDTGLDRLVAQGITGCQPAGGQPRLTVVGGGSAAIRSSSDVSHHGHTFVRTTHRSMWPPRLGDSIFGCIGGGDRSLELEMFARGGRFHRRTQRRGPNCGGVVDWSTKRHLLPGSENHQCAPSL